MIIFLKNEYRKFKVYTKNIPLLVKIGFIASLIYGGFMTYISSWDEIKYTFVNQEFITKIIPENSEPPDGKLYIGRAYQKTYKIFNNSGLPLKPMFVEIIRNHYSTLYREIKYIQPYDFSEDMIYIIVKPYQSGKDTTHLYFRNLLDSSLIKTQVEIFDVE